MIKYNAGNRGRREAEILNFCKLEFILTFSSHLPLWGEEDQSWGPHSPVCLLRWALHDIHTQTFLDPGHVWPGNHPHFANRTQLRFPECPEAQRWQQYIQALGELVTLEHGQAGILLEDRIQHGTILWKHNCSCQLFCLEEVTWWGEEHCTCSALLFPGILSPKRDKQPGKEPHCLGVVKQL